MALFLALSGMLDILLEFIYGLQPIFDPTVVLGEWSSRGLQNVHDLSE